MAKAVRHTARITDHVGSDSAEVNVSTSEKKIRGTAGGVEKAVRAAEYIRANPPIVLIWSAPPDGPHPACDAAICISNYFVFFSLLMPYSFTLRS